MVIPEHFYHPLFIHLPIALPFVLLFLLVLRRRDLLSARMEILSLSGIQIACSAIAFYSGAWASEAIVNRLLPVEEITLERHYILGRFVLIASVVAFVFIWSALFANRRQSLFISLGFVATVLLCVLVVLSGYTGGALVHEFGVNRLF